MSDPFDRPIVSPIMVGRDAHLDALRRRIDEALAGAGQMVLVAGEAGIGKSRLAAEAAAYARERGMRVLTAQCFEPDHALPYAPLRDLIRSHLLRQPWATGILAEVAADLHQLVPELARLLPDGNLPPRAGIEHDRRQVAHAFSRLVEGIAALSPLLLIVEDAHWSDEASLDLLVQLAGFVRAACGRPAVLIVTYRSDEISPQLAAALAACDRARLAAEARLGPLPRAEVAAMLRAMSDRHGALNADLADTIYRLSEGNPFFVEELLRSALAMDGQGPRRPAASGTGAAATAIPLPRSVAEAVRRRVSRLSVGARATLTLAAVSGRRIDFALLTALSGSDEAQLVGHIKELVAARLIVEESADRFAFRHALMRQAIDDGLLVRERRALHRQALEAILRSDPDARDQHAADLTRHAVEAGAWAEALEFGRRAGEPASRPWPSTRRVPQSSCWATPSTRPGASISRLRRRSYDAAGRRTRRAAISRRRGPISKRPAPWRGRPETKPTRSRRSWRWAASGRDATTSRPDPTSGRRSIWRGKAATAPSLLACSTASATGMPTRKNRSKHSASMRRRSPSSRRSTTAAASPKRSISSVWPATSAATSSAPPRPAAAPFRSCACWTTGARSSAPSSRSPSR